MGCALESGREFWELFAVACRWAAILRRQRWEAYTLIKRQGAQVAVEPAAGEPFKSRITIQAEGRRNT